MLVDTRSSTDSDRDTPREVRLFTGNATTGRYCRSACETLCEPREPRRLFASAAAAESAGFRPCPACRPEFSPAFKVPLPEGRLAVSAAMSLEAGGLRTIDPGDLAGQLGTDAGTLNKAFVEHHGVAPDAYIQVQRTMLARHLLGETDLTHAEAARAAGFAGAAAMRAALGLVASVNATRRRVRSDPVPILIGYRPPYAWNRVLAFLDGRAIEGVEKVSDGAYWRTIRVTTKAREHLGWLRVRDIAVRDCLEVTLARSLVPVIPAVLQRVKHLFDVAVDPAEISDRLGALADTVPGLRVPGAFDPFEMAVRAILGQQITVKAARTLAGRFAAAFGDAVETPLAGLGTCFPSPGTILSQSVDAIARLGIVGARTRAILALARALANGEIALVPHTDVERELVRLRALPGIGEWTAQYIAMRALGWPDAFPHTDYGVRKALGTTSDREVLARAEAWRPWRAYAVVHLWHSLHPVS